MSTSKAASRYALAFIGVAEEQKSLDEVGRDVLSLERLLRESKEFAAFIKSPVVNKEKKRKVLAEILEKTVGTLTMKFILILAAKDREDILPEILHQFNRLRDERQGIVNVTARTAVKFSEAQERALVAQIERATKKKVRISYVLDASLKGGFLVQHEDTVWDASVAHQLELLRERFATGAA
jgi:F-type H+-transporting ATPase subunit delta